MTPSPPDPEPWIVAYRIAPESIADDPAPLLDILVDLGVNTVCVAPGPETSRVAESARERGLRLITGFGDSTPVLCALDSREWNASTIVTQIANHESALPEGAWPAWELECPEGMPPGERLGAVQAQNALLLLLTLRGTPVIGDLPEFDAGVALFRRLLALRQAEPALATGNVERIWHEESILAWIRCDDSHRFLIAINVAPSPGTLFMGEGESGQVVLGTDERRSRHAIGAQLDLAPEEGVIVRLAPAPSPQS